MMTGARLSLPFLGTSTPYGSHAHRMTRHVGEGEATDDSTVVGKAVKWLLVIQLERLKSCFPYGYLLCKSRS